MKTLATHRHELERRLAALLPNDQPRWGTLTPHQMICHLGDAARMALGERHVAPASGLFQRTLLKWGALRLPIVWVQNYPTLPELDQRLGAGTPPTHFDQDRATALAQLTRLANDLPDPPLSHPIFGTMTAQDWSIWAYRHTDHHLRQFGR